MSKRIPKSKIAGGRLNNRAVLRIERLEDRNLLHAGFESAFEWSAESWGLYDQSNQEIATDEQLENSGTFVPSDENTQADLDSTSFAELDYVSILGITPDNGAFDSDGITNDAEFSVFGVGTPGAQFELYIGDVEIGPATVNADGEWSVALPSAVSEGTHEFKVFVNAQDQTDSYWVEVDLTPPTLQLTAPEFTTSTTPFVLVSLDEIQDMISIDVDLNGDGDFNDDGETDHTQEYAWGEETTIMMNELGEGSYTLRARTLDFAGNVGISESAAMQVDPHAGFVGSHYLLELFEDYAFSGDGTFDDGTTASGSAGVGDLFFGGEMETGGWNGENDLGPDNGDELMMGWEAPDLKKKYSVLIFSEDGDQVLVSVRATLAKHVDTLQSDLKALGMEVVSVTKAQYMVTGYFPISKIMDLEQVKNFSAVSPVFQPIRRAGSVDAQGDAPMLGPEFRSSTGATGQGISVGVLSDTVDRVDTGGDGSRGLAESQATGDLPSGVNVLLDGAAAGATDEGRAMLEIIHDIAPGAGLAFNTAGPGPQGFANGIVNLANAGVQVIVDDIGYLNSPIFNDGVIAQAADQVTAQGAYYFSAAGNDGDEAYESVWRGVTGTAGGQNGTFQDLDPGAGTDILQNFTLAQGSAIQLTFQWDDSFLEGGAPGAFQVNTEMEVIITNAANALVTRFNTNNLNSDEALEIVSFTNTQTNTNFAFAFRHISGPAPTRIKWISFATDPQAERQGGSTSFGQIVARGANAVAASPWYDPTVPESFTSFGGPISILFDSAGNRLGTAEIRTKPEFTAPDAVNTSFFGIDIAEDSDSLPNFFGTSAAAPHAAAAAALILSQNPNITPDQLRQHMQTTALDIGAPGLDPLTGSGLIQIRPFVGGDVPDQFEPNDSSDQAIDFGTLAGPVSVNNLSITRNNNIQDFDWYQFTAGQMRTVSITLDNIQSSGDIHVRIYRLTSRFTLQETAASTQVGSETQSVDVGVTAGDRIFVYVFGSNFATGMYDFSLAYV